MSEKRYIGVDLGAWSGTKTRIAILSYNHGNLRLLKLEKEPTVSTKNPEIRNKKLTDCLFKASDVVDTVIAIDAPFAIPSLLGCFKSIEQYYPYLRKKEQEPLSEKEQNKDKKLAIQNQYLYDNSARFVYERTQQRVLAPTATLVGALTSRMVNIVDNYSDELGICRTPHLQPKGKKISTIEVFPAATLYQIIKSRGKGEDFNKNDYLEHYSSDEEVSGNFTKIKSYKKDKKNSLGYFNYIDTNEGLDNKKRMLELIEPYIVNLDDWKIKIKTDDDYDAIICALTAYWVDQKDGYEVPKNNCKKFTNSFIYIPKIDVMLPK